jgi:hypothetical protein
MYRIGSLLRSADDEIENNMHELVASLAGVLGLDDYSVRQP